MASVPPLPLTFLSAPHARPPPVPELLACTSPPHARRGTPSPLPPKSLSWKEVLASPGVSVFSEHRGPAGRPRSVPPPRDAPPHSIRASYERRRPQSTRGPRLSERHCELRGGSNEGSEGDENSVFCRLYNQAAAPKLRSTSVLPRESLGSSSLKGAWR